MRDLWVDVWNPLLDLLGRQTQGRHAALKIQVSQSMNYGNGARNRVFDPLDVRLGSENNSHSTLRQNIQVQLTP